MLSFRGEKFKKNFTILIEMVECQEPKCRNEATRKWNGRNVCEDHYEQYREEQDRRIMEMRSNYD